LGKQDEAGNFYFIERKSGMLKVAGLQVYPLEIELALLRHPAVEEAAVIGVEDNLRGEVPKAFVVLKNEPNVTERELLQYCLETMARYKAPKVIEFRAELPKSGSGKINKKALKLGEA
jgi:long-chain acyl-CoA synthetase